MIDSDARYDVQAAFCHNGSVAACFMGSVFELYAVDAASEQPRFGGIRESIGPYIHDNRCRIAKYFLEHTDKQWLWMIDNDMEFKPDALRKLLDAAEEHDIKLIGAAYWNQYARGQCYLSWLLFTKDHGIKAAPFLPEELGEDPIEVTALGMGCTLIHRDVVQAVSDMYLDDPWSTFGADCLVQLEDGGFLIARVPDEWQESLGGRKVKQIDRMGEDVTFPVDPATAVLGSDWRWRPIGDYGVGDQVLGFDETSPRFSSRRYQRAAVANVVERRLPRLRLVTDECDIITTAEHPWLTRRHSHHGWEWAAAGVLEPGMLLASVMPRVENPDIRSSEYAAGYAQGLLHSDGTRTSSQFVIRMKDVEPLERMATMLAQIGIASRRGPSRWDGDPRHAPMHRLSINEGSSWSRLDAIWRISGISSKGFAAGYLAGMFDGDGSYHGGKLQIHSIRDAYKDRLESAARLLGVPFSGRGPRSVWLHGQDRLFGFWQATLPSLSRRTNPIGQLANDGFRRTGQEVRHRPQELLALERLPRADVLCLETASSTFIAEGLASHNCLRARRAGFPTYGLPTVTAEHYKAHFMSHGSSAAQSNGSSSSAGALPSAVASETPTGS